MQPTESLTERFSAAAAGPAARFTGRHAGSARETRCGASLSTSTSSVSAPERGRAAERTSSSLTAVAARRLYYVQTLRDRRTGDYCTIVLIEPTPWTCLTSRQGKSPPQKSRTRNTERGQVCSVWSSMFCLLANGASETRPAIERGRVHTEMGPAPKQRAVACASQGPLEQWLNVGSTSRSLHRRCEEPQFCCLGSLSISIHTPPYTHAWR